MTNTRFGRKVVSKKCPNKQCRNHKGSMNDIGSRDFVNCICLFCGCHYAGDVDKPLKFWTRKEWEQAIEESWAQG